MKCASCLVKNPGFAIKINDDDNRLPLLWFVDNIDAILSEFKARDIEIECTLKEHAYGLREFSFIDINGYYIRVAESTDTTT